MCAVGGEAARGWSPQGDESPRTREQRKEGGHHGEGLRHDCSTRGLHVTPRVTSPKQKRGSRGSSVNVVGSGAVLVQSRETVFCTAFPLKLKKQAGSKELHLATREAVAWLAWESLCANAFNNVLLVIKQGMDEASNLEEELEQELLLEPEEKQLSLSTPRQRLEEARAMADGSYDVVTTGGEGDSVATKNANGGDEEEQQSSAHLLQVRCVSNMENSDGTSMDTRDSHHVYVLLQYGLGNAHWWL